MQYKTIKKAAFISRPNRFIAKVCLDNQEETVHVKNTGRCKELLLENAEVYLEEAQNTKRKTKYSLVGVKKGKFLINMDSQAPNQVVAEALAQGKISPFKNIGLIKREVSYKNSRFDIYFETDRGKCLMEVKGVTLEEDGVARFPDAPTQRGRKHILELIDAKENGYTAVILFLIQMKGPKCFKPNNQTDPEFGKVLKEAKKQGVEIMVFDSIVTKDSIVLDAAVPFVLE